jgi:hypothetical protein
MRPETVLITGGTRGLRPADARAWAVTVIAIDP